MILVKYQADQEALRRNSLAYRNQQGHMERMLEASQLESQRAEEIEQLENSVQGWRDARAAEEANKAAARRELAGNDGHHPHSNPFPTFLHNNLLLYLFFHIHKCMQKNWCKTVKTMNMTYNSMR